MCKQHFTAVPGKCGASFRNTLIILSRDFQVSRFVPLERSQDKLRVERMNGV